MDKINLEALFRLVLRNLVLFICVAIAAAGGAYFYCEKMVQAKFSASGSVLITNGAIIVETYKINGEEGTINGSDISASRQLTDTVISLLKKPGIYKQLAKQNPQYSYNQLRGMTSISPEDESTMFVVVSVTSLSSEESVRLVNDLIDLIPSYIKELIPNSIATVTSYAEFGGKVYPNKTFTMMAAVIVCDGIVFLIIFLRFILNKIIRNEQEFKRRFDIPVLAVIPNFENPKGERSYKNKYYKKYRRRGYYYNGY